MAALVRGERPAPLGAEQPVVQPQLTKQAWQRTLGIVDGVLQKNATNSSRFVNQNRVPKRQCDRNV